MNKHKVDDLKPALAWLLNCEVNDPSVKGLRKQQLIEATLLAIERLLPDTCSECEEEYTVARDIVPSLQCSGCQQGIHQECLAALLGSETVPKLPGKMLWLCNNCEPYYSLMTTTGPGGCAKPNSKRAVGVAIPNQQPIQTTPIPPAPTEQVHSVTEDEETPVEEPVSDCPLLFKNECPHGLSGKKAGGCKFRHRVRCLKYMKWGDKHANGCKQSQCPKLHPELCVRSLALECFDKKCQAKLHTKRCRRSPVTTTSQGRTFGHTKPQHGNNHGGASSGGYSHGGAGSGGRKQGGGGSGGQHRGGPSTGRNHSGSWNQIHQSDDVGQYGQHCAGNAWAGQVSDKEGRQGFPNMTVQPQLEAFMQALMKQQQELTRITLKEITAQLGTCGVRGTCHSHSSC